MRTIKFRAWANEGEMKMIYFTLQDLYGEQLQSILNEPHELMQFTGLTDKNGKPIFEGDIVKMVADDLFSGEQIIEVKWRKEGFWEYFNGFENCEVIGNIYDNPELIK